MKLKKVKRKEYDVNLKATIHKSGKLGFTMDAKNVLDLNEHKYASIFTNDEDEEDRNLYIQIHQGEGSDEDFKVAKAGVYYYLNTKSYFDHLKCKYEESIITYNISKEEIEGDEYFVFYRQKDRAREEGSGSSEEGLGSDGI